MSSAAAGPVPEPLSLELGALLALSAADHVGPAAVRGLIERHGGPLEALAASPRDDRLSDRQRRGASDALAGRAAEEAARAATDTAASELEPGDRLLGYGLEGYPPRLSRLHFPPPVLWARGPLPADSPRAVAVVGTRRATAPARQLAHDIARGLAEFGVRVVSGLASGIDGAAHRGAVAAGGETAAVLGSGLGFRYPRPNHDLYLRLRRDGLLLTEFPPRQPPEPHNFPRRNRIVAALADAVLVVQAGVRSGALLTADEAKEIGVEVLACPGDPRLAGSIGCHRLLRDGAGLVTDATDVLECLGWTEQGAPPVLAEVGGRPFTERELALITRLEQEPAGLGELAELVGGIGAAAAVLARLELSGEIYGMPGGRYGRAQPTPAQPTPAPSVPPAPAAPAPGA